MDQKKTHEKVEGDLRAPMREDGYNSLLRGYCLGNPNGSLVVTWCFCICNLETLKRDKNAKESLREDTSIAKRPEEPSRETRLGKNNSPVDAELETPKAK